MLIVKVLAYQRRCRVRISYNWRELWSTLIGRQLYKVMIKFVYQKALILTLLQTFSLQITLCEFQKLFYALLPVLTTEF